LENRILQKILLSILAGHHKVTEIRIDTRIHPETLARYLTYLKRKGFIEYRVSNYKRGQAKPCLLTMEGLFWLVENALGESLGVLAQIVEQMRNTEIRRIYQRTNEERFSRNVKLVKDMFIERFLNGDNSPLKYPEGFQRVTLDDIFALVQKKLLALYWYLGSDSLNTEQDPEIMFDRDFVLFAPHMRFAFSWHPGAFPELDCELQKVENYLLTESRKNGDTGKSTSVGSHLLGLEQVDEKYFEEYLSERSKIKREKLLLKIETEAGWSVGKYLGMLLKGQEEEILKFIDKDNRPALMKFVTLFDQRQVK
jgi:hypothetical protein